MNEKDNLIQFDFDSIKFPIIISDLVFEYLYIQHSGDSLHPISKEQFRNILNGEDRSQEACTILNRLFKSYNGHREFPKEDFDILSDNIVKTCKSKDAGVFKMYEDIHQGECCLGESVFDFEYIVKRSIDSFHNHETTYRGSSTVCMKGHSFKHEDTYMHEACIAYLQKEEQIETEKQRKEGEEIERQIWIEFRQQHEQELKDWLIPIIENQFRFHICQRMKNSVYKGFPDYGFVKALDRGHCTGCATNCLFKEHLLPINEHSKEWYEIGLDKLNFKYL